MVSYLVESHADAERKISLLKKGLRRRWLVLEKDTFIYRGKDGTALFSKNCHSSSVHSMESNTVHLL